MEARPQAISKLATYIQDKEPFIYLFIINTDFILDDEYKVLPMATNMAGVTVKDRRIKFYYTSNFINLPKNKLYFVLLHEAFHIFKKHLTRFPDLFKENWALLNMSQDAIINEEIKDLTINYELSPEILENAMIISDEFKKEHYDLGKNAYTTRRVYSWFKNRKLNKEDLLQKDSHVRIKGTDDYGRIEEKNSNGTYKVKKMSKDEMLDEIFGGEEAKGSGKGNYKSEELIPVVNGNNTCGSAIEGGFGVEVIQAGSFDAHLDGEEEENVDQEVLAKKLFEKAKEMEKNLNSLKNASNKSGNFTSKIEELYKSRVNWKKELNKHLHLHYSNNCNAKTTKQSFITYPWNPKSRYGILCKHHIEEVSNLQKYIILAIDTSGSIFFDKDEVKTFFTEIEALSKWLDFSNEGKVLTVQWDTEVSEGLKPYERGDWKRYDLKGGGGTVPQCVFKYLTNIYKKKGSHYHINENGIKMLIPDKKKIPFLLFLTDGYFYNNLEKKELGVYEGIEKNMAFLTTNDNYLFKNARTIMYEQ